MVSEGESWTKDFHTKASPFQREDPKLSIVITTLHRSLPDGVSCLPQTPGVLNPSDLTFQFPSQPQHWPPLWAKLDPTSQSGAHVSPFSSLSASPAQTHVSLPCSSNQKLPPECGYGVSVFHNGPVTL